MNNSDFQACYKCLKRHVGCHSKCHDYLKEAANHQIEKERRRKEKEMENICGRKYQYFRQIQTKKRRFFIERRKNNEYTW